MDGTDHEHELPPKRGTPPPFRRNRAAAAAVLCGLGFAAGMGVQWSLSRRPAAGPAPDAAAPRAVVPAAGAPDASQPRRAGPLAAPVVTAAAPSPDRAAATATVGLSRRALVYGQRLRPAAPAAEPAGAAPPEPPPAPGGAAPEARAVEPAPAKPPVARATAPVVRARPRPARAVVASRRAADAAPPRPSFDCARASTPGERVVCGDARLARLDRRMDAAFRRALAGARDPRGLQADQDRWMAVREGAALRDPSMVGPAYERRIAELAETDW